MWTTCLSKFHPVPTAAVTIAASRSQTDVARRKRVWSSGGRAYGGRERNNVSGLACARVRVINRQGATCILPSGWARGHALMRSRMPPGCGFVLRRKFLSRLSRRAGASPVRLRTPRVFRWRTRHVCVHDVGERCYSAVLVLSTSSCCKPGRPQSLLINSSPDV